MSKKADPQNFIPIPEARELLMKWADETPDMLARRRMRWLARRMFRRPPMRPKVFGSQDKMSPYKSRRIRRLAREYPEMTYQDIATECNVNMARVSEVLTGKRP